MPLPPPAVARSHVHTRRITCEAFERTDGLWDIDASMSDVKTYNTRRGKAGAPLHHMWVRLTIDTDYVIKDIASAMDAFPQEACPFAVRPMQELVGVRIGAGWQGEVRKRIGGALGCTHLRELLAPMATTAMQAMGNVLRHRGVGGGSKRQGKGSCFAKSDEQDRAHYRETFRQRTAATPAP
jgi:DUF2889 family protein